MNDPQAQQQEFTASEFLVQTLQRQRNSAMDELAKAETALSVMHGQLEKAGLQNKALNELNESLVRINTDQEETIAALRAQVGILSTKLDQHAHGAQQAGLVGSLMTTDNPPASTPDIQAQAGAPGPARGLES